MACEVRPSLSDILSFFNTVFLPFSGSIGVQPVTFDDFCYAFSMVSSRAFRVDNYHTLALVPIADAFNHAEENTVHLETDYFARATTGSTVSTTEEDCCEMVTNAVLYGGEEILFTVQEIEDYLAHTPSQRTRLSMQLLNELWQDLFESQELWVECLPTSSPFFPPFIEETEDDMDRESLGKRLDNERLSATFFAINASAQISPALWLYLLLRRAPQAVLDSIAPPVVQARNESLLGYLRDLAKRMSLLDVEDEECEIHGLRLGSCQALIDIAVDILTICRARLASMHWSDRPISEIAELEGALQRSRYRRRTEIAVRFALNERLILDSCIKMWENIESQLANFGADHSV
ncbi:uncharacterized protein EI90DRAFT_1839856 [Cantharellus anzutake]|uniref:uncharacterized protein n=1 Tax=Cantharellus anzutake TaxID=1750568 RepID=UPI0019050A42|nr:uncharacterized protein EI90DRAFT_1839856 [Cantharellus anzutake]KAF8327285.1 hypothetical protein EI90DRAFT_1839856 [Cantharellus anzutake]